MLLTGKKAVIFDLDGSLVDSMWLWREVDRIYMEKYRLTPPKGFHQEIEGMSYEETVDYFLKTFPALPCSAEEIGREWEDMTLGLYAAKVPLKAGAGEFLKEAKARGLLLGVATSNSRTLVEVVLKALGVFEDFASVRTSGEVSAGKPAPYVYLKVAEDLRVSPGECLVFEDVPKGILAGKNAGMTVCAVEDAFSKSQEDEKRRLADFYIRDYYDVLRCTYEICGEKGRLRRPGGSAD